MDREPIPYTYTESLRCIPRPYGYLWRIKVKLRSVDFPQLIARAEGYTSSLVVECAGPHVIEECAANVRQKVQRHFEEIINKEYWR